MPTSTIKDWIAERERSPYRTKLFYNGGYLILHQEPNKPDNLTRFPFYNIFTKNRKFFEDITLQMPFEKVFYYQPKKLSMNLYRDIGLWHILLILNKCRSEIDFIGDKVFYLDPNKVMEYMTRMFVNEEIDTTIYGS